MKTNASLLAAVLLSLAASGQASELSWRAPTHDPLPFRAPVPAPGGALFLDNPEGLIPMNLESQPSWTQAKTSQGWAWPNRLTMLGGAQPEAPGPIASRKILSWFPANPEGSRLLYLVKDAAGHEERLTENQIIARQTGPRAQATGTLSLKEIQAAELTTLLIAKGAASARDVSAAGSRPMAEFTYADGHKEVAPYDPLVFDLKGTGVKTDAKKTLFDLYGYGQQDKLQWMNDIDEGTGILVFDSNQSGRSGQNGSEVFGDRTDLDGSGGPDGFVNGFEALRAFVSKAVDEGVLKPEVLSLGILEADALASLEKAYGLKMKLGGFNRAPISLSEAGIAAIALSQAPTLRAEDFDGRANDLLVQPGAVFLRKDGTTGCYMNLWLKAKSGNVSLARR